MARMQHGAGSIETMYDGSLGRNRRASVMLNVGEGAASLRALNMEEANNINIKRITHMAMAAAWHAQQPRGAALVAAHLCGSA
jgi:hypothetical protein